MLTVFFTKMKVLLIAPNYLKVYSYVSEEATMIAPPMGLAYIAGHLRDKGINVQVLDLAALRSDDKMERKLIMESNADMVAMAATTNTVMLTYDLAKISKEVLPGKNILCLVFNRLSMDPNLPVPPVTKILFFIIKA